MRSYYGKNLTYFIHVMILLVFTILVGWFVFRSAPVAPLNLVWLGCILLIVACGLLYGQLISLGTSLLILFLFGTTQIWLAYISAGEIMPSWEIVLWMILFPAAAVVTGRFNKWLSEVLAENQEMKEKFNSLVTIDEATGFDNQKRFHFQLEEEFKRTQRTGTPFSLLFIKIEYFSQFQSLYGERETNHLLRSFSEILWENLRMTDRKFRIADDTFAIILSNTMEENTSEVIQKIENLLRFHMLKSKKKQITLTISFGIASYHEEVTDFMELIQYAQNDLEQYVQ